MTTTSNSLLRHVVLFSFRNEASAAQVDAVVKQFGALKDAIPGILHLEWGTNVSPEGLNAGFTHCFTLSFGDAGARDAYLVHPAHQRFVESLGTCLDRSLVIDYWSR